MAEKLSFAETVQNAVAQAMAAALPQVIAAVAAQKPAVVGKATPNIGKNGRNLDAKDRALVTGFKRRGVKEDTIVLWDRKQDIKDPTITVRPYGGREGKVGWLEMGRQVRKGEKSLRGLFHKSQTDEIAKPKATN